MYWRNVLHWQQAKWFPPVKKQQQNNISDCKKFSLSDRLSMMLYSQYQADLHWSQRCGVFLCAQNDTIQVSKFTPF